MKVLAVGLKNFLRDEVSSELYQPDAVFLAIADDVIPINPTSWPIIGILLGDDEFESEQLSSIEMASYPLADIIIYEQLTSDDTLLAGDMDELADGILSLRTELRDILTGNKLGIVNHERTFRGKNAYGSPQDYTVYTSVEAAIPVAESRPSLKEYEGFTVIRTSLTMKYKVWERKI